MNSKALVVDLDGTLIKTDTLWECLLLAVKTKPWIVALLPFFIFKGRAFLKASLAQWAPISVELLPYRKHVINYLREQKGLGRAVYLATGADISIAQRVANFLNLFDGVFASNGIENLKGRAKLKRLTDHLGENGFEYIGDSLVDLPLWEHSKSGIAINPPASLRPHLEKLGVLIWQSADATWRLWFKALRVHQWSKNTLIFLPLLTGYHLLKPGQFWQTVEAFLSFSLMASAVYICNDLSDLESDRSHPKKRFRPFASGNLTIPLGILAAFSLIAVSLALALRLPHSFGTIVMIYFITNITYSLYLRSAPIVDVLFLAVLYSARIFAGAVSVELEVSEWLLAFSTFFFLGLAMIKRFSEIRLIASHDNRTPSRRGYQSDDEPLIFTMGIVSSYLSVLVFAFYIDSAKVKLLYRHPEVLWLCCPLLLYWLSMLWLKARRNHVHSDTIVFAAKEPMTYIVGTALTLLFLVAK